MLSTEKKNMLRMSLKSSYNTSYHTTTISGKLKSEIRENIKKKKDFSIWNLNNRV